MKPFAALTFEQEFDIKLTSTTKQKHCYEGIDFLSKWQIMSLNNSNYNNNNDNNNSNNNNNYYYDYDLTLASKFDQFIFNILSLNTTILNIKV